MTVLATISKTKLNDMKNFIWIALILILTCGCSTPKMTSSIWCTAEPVQNKGQEGLRITSLHMLEDGKVDIYQSVIADSNLVVAPFLFAKGTYNITGNTKKEATISVNGKTIKQKNFNWVGIIDLKKESMLLNEADSTANVYFKYGNLTIQQ